MTAQQYKSFVASVFDNGCGLDLYVNGRLVMHAIMGSSKYLSTSWSGTNYRCRPNTSSNLFGRHVRTLLQRKCCYVLARVEPNIVVVQLPRDLSTTLSGTNYRCPSINLQAGVGTIAQLSCRPNTSRLAGQL